MMEFNARSWPPRKCTRRFHRHILRFRQWLKRHVDIRDGQFDYRFRCETVREFNRCLKLFTKEPGTVAWISQNVKSGDVFYDIGANIGVYTILAASRAAKNGRVYAFEPHGANFARLLDSIIANNFQRIVFPSNLPLHDGDGYFSFHYKSADVGTSDSQLSGNRGLTEGENAPQISELKYAATVDHLIDSGEISAPHHIKIDVDGNELLILKGMSHLLSGRDRPITIQVEMNGPHKMKIVEFMEDHRFQMDHKHYTRSGSQAIEGGSDPETLCCNAVFRQEK